MSKTRYDMIGDVAVITMMDPSTMNAAGLDMVLELQDAFARAAKSARAIVFTGEGRGFCSGANLTAGGGLGNSPDPSQFDAGAALDSHYNPLVTQIRDLPIPIVTAVNGAAAGVGCSFALLGDLIIAGQSAYFLQAFRRIGLVPDGGSTYMLMRAVGRARAMEMMLLGEKIPADKALEWGLINRVVPDQELGQAALALATELASGPTKSLGLIRKAGWESLDNGWADQIRLERELQRDAGRTAGFREGVTGFLTKTKAIFSGN
jgi:2-(1,2-epoxy-1,2-dihydrophenyl)acetyl-CoA isomerase